MKKITLVFLILFVVIVSGVLALSLFYPSNVSVVDNLNVDSTSKTGITIREVSSHLSPNDCYLIVKDKVYNVSSYINNHPGGKRNITDNCGQKVTGLFASIHSNFAWDLLGKYYIGNLVSP